MLKRIAVVVAAGMAALIGAPFGSHHVQAAPVQDLTAMTNADRAAHGLRALSTASDLQSVAQRRADEMARSGRLAHTSNLGSKVSGWKRLGENVGRGPNLRDIQTAFMASASHRKNILDSGFTQLGVGVTFDGKEFLYVAVIFRTPSTATASAPPPPPPTTTATTRAASAPRPRPTTTTQRPTTTTTQPPTTTTTAPPPPPPVEQVAPPVEQVAPPVESTTTTVEATTTTTAPRPIFSNPDFLAANFSDNFSDHMVPAVATMPVPGRSPVPIVLAALLGLLVGSGCTAFAMARPDQLPVFSRRRHWR